MSYAKYTKPKPQSVYVKTDKDQVKNSSGAYVNQVDNWTMLSRFLVLGTEKPTYHAGTKNITKNIKSLDACLKEDGKRVVDTLHLLTLVTWLLIVTCFFLFALAYALKKVTLILVWLRVRLLKLLCVQAVTLLHSRKN